MMPIGLLMIEHRLIERAIAVVSRQIELIAAGGAPDPRDIDGIVDFLHTYADRYHHGKEEDILFRDLARHGLSPEHEIVMRRLIEEHEYARRTAASLGDANSRFTSGDPTGLAQVEGYLRALEGLYPAHIDLEDHHFFRPIMAYFTPDEQQAMLEEFREFDRELVHERYRDVVARLSARATATSAES